MKFPSSKFIKSLGIVGLLSALVACGDDSKEASTSDTMIVEVGGGQTGFRLLNDVENPEGSVSETEIKQCEDVFQGPVAGWKISGSQNLISMEPTEAFATKITGNKNRLNLVIKAKDGETEVVSFPGVCLILGGNQPTVDLSLQGVSLDKLKVVARGNSATLSIALSDNAKIPEGSVAELGKHVSVTVTTNTTDK